MTPGPGIGPVNKYIIIIIELLLVLLSLLLLLLLLLRCHGLAVHHIHTDISDMRFSVDENIFICSNPMRIFI